MARDMEARVAGYRPLAESLAAKVAGSRRAKAVGAEVDDLIQEGLIDAWQALGRGVTPSAEMMENRMRTYVRWLGRQTPVEYETMLPLDDFRVDPEERVFRHRREYGSQQDGPGETVRGRG